jgi:hypothetical protein
MYGGVPGWERGGYRLVIPGGSLEPGAHRLFVCASADVAREANCSSLPFEVL